VLGICACATFALVWCLGDRAALPASRLAPVAPDTRAGPRSAASTQATRSVIENPGRRLALCVGACTARQRGCWAARSWWCAAFPRAQP
jgi:hypothetical protein